MLAAGGVTCAACNIVGAIVIPLVLRLVGSDRDAVVAGLGAGALAALPALLFFIGMTAFMPDIAAQALPSNDLLTRPRLTGEFQ